MRASHGGDMERERLADLYESLCIHLRKEEFLHEKLNEIKRYVDSIADQLKDLSEDSCSIHNAKVNAEWAKTACDKALVRLI
jgi:hypothetical protein